MFRYHNYPENLGIIHCSDIFQHIYYKTIRSVNSEGFTEISVLLNTDIA